MINNSVIEIFKKFYFFLQNEVTNFIIGTKIDVTIFLLQLTLLLL